MMLPSPKLLEKISFYSKQKGGVNYCLFLLTYQSGLRVSEAVSFNLKVQQNGFFLVRSKGGFRSVYVSKQVVCELKANHWQPNSLTRFGFYKFLRRVRKELKIEAEIELSPHTLRRCWTTYYAEKGVPLPVLSKGLGHKSVRTTALYWKSEREISQLVIREWLEKRVLIFEKKVEKEEIYKQKVWKLEEENRLLVEKVRELEKKLKNKTDLAEKEEIKEKDQEIRTQIEWRTKKIYV